MRLKMELQIEYVDIDSIKPYESNARQHGSEDIKAIADSIKEFGFKDPIGIWKDTIVEGHGRLFAAKEIGMKTVPVIRLDDLTDEQRRAYALAHNKTAELSSWDFNLMNLELTNISEIDMSLFGFDKAAAGSNPEVEDEKDLFEDVENLEQHYGVPYQGNKSRIADRIIHLLPEGDRLVDLFGGGVR